MNAIITGATKGIGKAIAIKLAQNGYNLALCARNENDLLLLRNELSKFNVDVFTMVTDCSLKADVLAFVAAVQKAFPTIDVLVNNVGVFLPGSLLDENDEVFELQQQLNLNATYYMSKYIGKIMRTQQYGHLFNMCSIASIETLENSGSYCVTKSAMRSLNYVLRKELAPYNVKVTAILPGATFTDSWAGTTIGREKFMTAQDVAEVLFSALTLSSVANVDEIVLRPINF
jgi:short-subunit dehydrogenase